LVAGKFPRLRSTEAGEMLRETLGLITSL